MVIGKSLVKRPLGSYRETSWSRLIIIFLVLFGGIILGLAISEGKLLPPIIIVGGGLLALVMMNPRVAIFLLILWVPFQYLLSSQAPDPSISVLLAFNILPRQAVWLDEIILFGLVLFLAARMVRARSWRRTPIDIFVLFFIIWGLGSSVVNSVPPLNVVLGFRSILQYVLLYYVLVNLSFEEKYLKFLVILILSIGLIQVPFSIYEFLVTGRAGDTAFGTLGTGGTGNLGHLLTMLMAVLLGLARFDIARRSRYLAMFFALMVPLVFASAKFSYYAAVVIFLWMARGSLKTLMAIFLVSCLLAGTVYLTSHVLSGEETTQLLPEYLLTRQASTRYDQYGITWEIIKDYAPNPAIGLGPGAYVSSAGWYFNARFYQLYMEKRGLLGSNIEAGLADIATVGAEYGLIGLAFFLAILIALYQMGRHVYAHVTGNFWKGVTFGFQGTVLFFGLGAIPGQAWQSQPVAMTFWVLAAVVCSIGLKRGL